MKYYVEYATYSRKFNEHYIAHQYTNDLKKFCLSHNVVKAVECVVGKSNRIISFGNRVI